MGSRLENRLTWREYQVHLKRKSGHRYRMPRFFRIRWIVVVMGLLALIFGIKACFRHTQFQPSDDFLSSGTEKDGGILSGKSGIQKKDIRGWVSPGDVVNLESKRLDIQVAGEHFLVETSIDTSLQAHLLKKIQNSDAEQMGLVVLDPDDGRILAMVGVDEDGISENPCLYNQFPAASIFKIVTATAAIEQCNFTPETKLTFNGGKYTLYKSQLKNSVNRYTSTISFKDSFAQSVNPVFGKIGTQVGKENLDKYGKAFGFNSYIDFDVEMPASILEVSEGDYHLAEVACGFNRTTTLSPLHGAMIAAAVMNGGRMPQPAMVERIIDASGLEVYHTSPSVFREAMSGGTSTILGKMMRRTVTSGTCRKTFRTVSGDRVLSMLNIGGKSGSIDNRQHSRRMDWFVGFAEEKNGSEKISVAVVVGHGKYIGTKAAEFAKYAIKDYFKEYFATVDKSESRNG